MQGMGIAFRISPFRPALAVLLALAWAPPATAQPAPTIDITVKREDVTFDFTRSHKELKSLAQCERPGVNGKYLGLSRANVRTNFSYRVALRPTGEGYEGGVVSIDVALEMDDRKVYVASEFPEGSCSFEETMDHEMRHVSIDNTLVEIFRGRIRKALETAIPSLTGLEGSQKDITETIQSVLNDVLDREMRVLRARRLERHKAFDSSEEYIKLGTSCDGETEALILASDPGDPGWHAPVECPAS